MNPVAMAKELIGLVIVVGVGISVLCAISPLMP